MMTFFTDFLEYDFLLYALLGTFFLSLTCGIISPLIIARKNAFMGAAISHSTLLGLAISLSLFEMAQSLPIFLSTLLITLILTFFFSLQYL
jgi:ABC-type Mn2+/Zn2+ transport system permease subunit